MGPIGLKLVTPPTAEPVTLAEAKARLRVDWTDDDADILGLIAEAREAAEGECGRQFVTATYALYLDRFPYWWERTAARGYLGYPAWPFAPAGLSVGVPEIRLPRPPCQSVTSVVYYDTAGNQQTLASNLYVVAAGGEPGRVTPAPGTVWPDTQAGRPEAVVVTYVAGYGLPPAVPRAAKGAVLDILAHRYRHRGDEAKAGIPPTARRLLDQLEYGEAR